MKIDFCQTEREAVNVRHATDIMAEWYADYFRKLGFSVVSFGTTPAKIKNKRIKLKLR